MTMWGCPRLGRGLRVDWVGSGSPCWPCWRPSDAGMTAPNRASGPSSASAIPTTRATTPSHALQASASRLMPRPQTTPQAALEVETVGLAVLAGTWAAERGPAVKAAQVPTRTTVA